MRETRKGCEFMWVKMWERSGKSWGRGNNKQNTLCEKKSTFNKTKNLEEKSGIPIAESCTTIISGNNYVIRLGTPVFA